MFGRGEPQRAAVVAGVLPGGPAERAGLREGDLVLEIGGERVDGSRTLLRRIAGAEPGAVLALTLLRDGREREVRVRVAARPPTPARP